MNDIEKRKLADQADMIVNGYAYTHTAQDFRVCNLNSEHCAVFSPTCEMLETNMDNIELHIARSYLLKNEYKIAGYYLYFTSHCTIEAMHVHASDRHLTESGSAKFFVKGNGDTVVQNRGILTDREISKIQAFIRMNYQEMYLAWAAYSDNSFYRG